MGSIDLPCFAAVQTRSGCPTRAQCFRFFLRIINPAARYARCTRLWFTCSPERPNKTCSRRYPKRGFSRANSTSRVRSGSSPQGYELQPFFRITDCRTSLSKLRSATSIRSFVFSSRSCFASCASLTSMPPYFFQAQSVCFDTPTFTRHFFHLPSCLHLLQRPDHLRLRVPALRHTLFPFLSHKSYSALCGLRGAGHDGKEYRRE
jgi:hypothetical protein